MKKKKTEKQKETKENKNNEHEHTQKTPDNNPESSYQTLYMRVVADFQNYKRRIAHERTEWIVDAKSEVLKPLLSVLDDLDRALDVAKGHKEIYEGLVLIKKNIEKTFTDLGVTPIDCSGKFDPDLHEALLQVESPDHESGMIVDVVAKGYMFGSQVLRHAKVTVAK